MATILINAPATSAIYTLSLHDALPISTSRIITPTPPAKGHPPRLTQTPGCAALAGTVTSRAPPPSAAGRSEEHTSELQSRENLVCRLLLEKKKKTRKSPNT